MPTTYSGASVRLITWQRNDGSGRHLPLGVERTVDFYELIPARGDGRALFAKCLRTAWEGTQMDVHRYQTGASSQRVEVGIVMGDDSDYSWTLGMGTPKGCRKERVCILDTKTGQAIDPMKFWATLAAM